MPIEPKTDDAGELNDLAFQIFSARIASHPAKRGGEHEALDSYRKAEAFLAVRRKVQGGALRVEKSDGPTLADCSAPNQHPTYPLNLVSQRYGDLAKVNRIAKWLEQNLTPHTADEDEQNHMLASFRKAFPDVVWQGETLDQTMAIFNTARVVFPAYVKN